MTRIAILGAAGYTALELIKILVRHPETEIVAVTDLQEGQPHVAMIHPSLTGRLDICVEKLSPAEIAARADCVFACLPHGVSASLVPHLLDSGTRVVDFSADYRLNAPDVFATLYNQNHGAPQRLGKVP
ncbi:MAG: N-acetyl-gamma-glutamyl-phosphate reductase, partial [Planctomycetes bacterium]|nr:N-acetyl-gamma-glutamyl-phosphate reductase [Planctomycetota bacterium]